MSIIYIFIIRILYVYFVSCNEQDTKIDEEYSNLPMFCICFAYVLRLIYVSFAYLLRMLNIFIAQPVFVCVSFAYLLRIVCVSFAYILRIFCTSIVGYH